MNKDEQFKKDKELYERVSNVENEIIKKGHNITDEDVKKLRALVRELKGMNKRNNKKN